MNRRVVTIVSHLVRLLTGICRTQDTRWFRDAGG